MVADEIVLSFSIIVVAVVVLWAVLMIRAFDRVGKND
jgi:hypothetical protein